MKESIIAPKYAVLSSEEFWCHVVDPKTQRGIWERSAKFVDSPPPPTEREVLIELLFCKKIKLFAEFSGVEVQHETKKMKVWASSIEHLSFFSSQLVFCVHHRLTLIRGFPMDFVSLLCVRPLSRRNFSAAHVMALPIVINLFLPCALLKFVHVTRQSRRSFRKKNSGSIPFTGLDGERTWFSWF